MQVRLLELKALRRILLERSRIQQTDRSFWYTACGSLSLATLLLWILQRGSFIDLRLVLSPVPGQYANRRAAAFCLLAHFGFYAGTIGLLLLLLQLRGNTSWDSTMLHFPTETVVFLLDATLPPLACAFVLVRSYHFPYMLIASPPLPSGGQHKARPSPSPGFVSMLLQYVRCLLLGDSPTYSDVSMIYLCKVYLFTFSVLSLLLLSCVQSTASTFILPQLILVRFNAEEGWTLRFQLLTLQLMTLILLAANTAMLRLWPSAGQMQKCGAEAGVRRLDTEAVTCGGCGGDEYRVWM